MKKVLILGGSVFLGRAAVRKFLSMGYTVYVLNRGTHETMEGTIPLIADRNNKEEVERVCKDIHFDVVFDGSAYTPLQTKNVIESINQDILHYIHISSASVYLEDNVYLYREDSKRGANPMWGEYGANKYLCEEVLFEEYYKNGFPITILRPFYLYGIENNLDRESYVFKRLLTSQTIIVPGKGLPVIQFGYVEDLCSAVEEICKTNRSCGNAYNISGDEYISFKSWIELCAKVLRVTPKIELVDAGALGLHPREWFPFRDVTMIGDCSKIRDDLGVKPAYTLEAGIREIADSTDLEKLIDRFVVPQVERDILSSITGNRYRR